MRKNTEGLPGPYFNPNRNSKLGQIIEPKFAPGEKLRVHPKMRWRSMGAAGLALCLVMDPLMAQIEASQSTQYVTQTKSSTDKAYQDVVINVAAGFGMNDARSAARTLSGFSAYGNIYADVYDNRTIDSESLGDDVIEKAKKNGVNEINFFGSSLAGIVSLEMAVKVQNDKSDLHTKYIILENTPADLESVRPEQRASGRLLLTFSGIPALSYSRTARYIAEMAVRTKQYVGPDINKTVPFLPFNFTKFIDTSAEVINEMISRTDKASVELMDSQYSTIVASNVRESMMKLGKDDKSGKPKPVIVFIRPTSSTRDYVVNSDLSEAKLRQYALDADLRFMVINMDTVHHGNPSMSPTEYAEVIPEAINQINETINNPLTPGTPLDPLMINNNFTFDDNILLTKPF